MPWIHEAFVQTKANRDWSGSKGCGNREGRIAMQNARINGHTHRSVLAIINGWGE